MKTLQIVPFVCLSLLTFAQTPYLHTDRSHYASQDTIWFKAYLFDEQKNLDQISSLLQVILIDDDSQTIATRTLRTKEGQTYAEIALPDTLRAGNYQLVAYAPNTQPDFYFRKFIQIFSKGFIKNTTNYTDSLDVQFLPEGGHLVAGLASVLGFRATDAKGNTVAVNGKVLDEQQNEVAIFQTEHAGMGRFFFVPQAQQRYTSEVLFAGKKYVFDLPKIEAQGVVMQVSNIEADSMAMVRVFQNFETLKPLTVQILANGKLYFSEIIPAKQATTIKIAKKQLPTGIIQIRLLDQETPLAERLAFFNRQQTLKISTQINSSFTPRTKTTIEVETKTEDGKPAEGVFSLSVCDADQVLANLDADMYSHVFLSADLRGRINNPAYYFDKNQAESYKHLDLLLMAQGWRAYRWTEKKVIQTEIENSPSIKGVVYQYGTKKVVQGVNIVYQQGVIVGKTTTDDKGEFAITEPELRQERPTYIQARKKHQEDFEIEILNDTVNINYENPTTDITANSPQEAPTRLSYSQTTIDAEPSINLEAVTITAQSTQEKAIKAIIRETAFDESSGINFAFQNATEIANDLPHVKSLTELIKKKIIQADIRTVDVGGSIPNIIQILAATGGLPPFNIMPIKLLKNKTVVCYVCLSNVLESTIQANNVVKMVYFNRTSDYQPALILITKDAIPNYDYSKDKTVGSIIRNDLGISPSKEFYSPRYDKSENSTQPDRRATLYWNANIKTDVNGKANIEFYNSDIAKKFHLNIQGTDGKGNVGSLQTLR